ncbi:peptidase M23-like protein [Kribbella orskensis]|uniref:Peptidase M23-like protein n=1 Tax=Kribbella orskensis TaxID=2512216 RepID=A0ABY2BFK8_9ACTN|nr:MULTISPECIES: M23 family metallopeptidase [Kribbella]TCN37628.1 peptidase M23-like protein [Kribbella sp. VKM Ac-2500]TCO18870.1 peptidase M23-like protein [Kribbella orskensis]
MNPSSTAARPNLTPRALAALLLAALPWLLPAPATAAPVPTAPPEAVWPLDPRPAVIRGFERPPKPWLPGHRGLDLAGSPGQPVRSATSGTITYAGPLAGRGVIVVSRGPIRTTYEPVVPAIKPGAAVAPGSILGTLSAAGSHCAPKTCLHWGLLQSDTYLNPLTLLRSKPVRLLPLTPATNPATLRPTADPPPNSHPTPQPSKGQNPAAAPNQPSPEASDMAAAPHQPTGEAGGMAAGPAQPTGAADGVTAGPDQTPGVAGGTATALDRPSGEGGDLAAGLVVAAAGVLTVGGGLMIRRH